MQISAVLEHNLAVSRDSATLRRSPQTSQLLNLLGSKVVAIKIETVFRPGRT